MLVVFEVKPIVISFGMRPAATKLNFYIHGMKARDNLNLPILVKLEGNPKNYPIGTVSIKT